jgi:LytS/YehU family sensor histidine kinase
MTGSGRIEVSAWREGDVVILSVRDDGPGPRAEWTPGVGLKNTEARLRQMYGARGRLTLRAGEAGGAVAEVELPFREAPAVPAAAAAR